MTLGFPKSRGTLGHRRLYGDIEGLGLRGYDFRVSQNLDTGIPHNKDYHMLESVWGFPYLGKLPYVSP